MRMAGWLYSLVGTVAVGACVMAITPCIHDSPDDSSLRLVRLEASATHTQPAPQAITPPAVMSTCVVCHQSPPPDILTKERWPHMLDHMVALMQQYDLKAKLTPEELKQVKMYYVSAAPVSIPLLEERFSDSPVRFAGLPFGQPPVAPAPGEKGQPPAMGIVRIVDLDLNGRPDVLACDLAKNEITLITEAGGPGRWGEGVLARVNTPAQAQVVDMTGDGKLDILVACLGSLRPTEDAVGSIILLEGDGQFGFRQHILAERTPRASDAHASDIDGDGDPDAVVAFFGMYKTGEIAWLEHIPGEPWQRHTIYQRNGVSHCPPADFNGDGLPDVAVLVSQEHEEIVVLMNEGPAPVQAGPVPTAPAAPSHAAQPTSPVAAALPSPVLFTPHTLWRAPHPLWGFSSIRLCDLDRDGDVDILATNGDALDADPKPKPFHGVQWLENRTPKPVPGQPAAKPVFVYHDIARFHGAYSVAAADFDVDGDLDLVVTSMMNDWSDPSRNSAIWLENVGQGAGRPGASLTFAPHPLDTSPCYLVSCDAEDLNQDGLPEVVATSMYVFEPYYRVGRITAWVNSGPATPPAPGPFLPAPPATPNR